MSLYPNILEKTHNLKTQNIPSHFLYEISQTSSNKINPELKAFLKPIQSPDRRPDNIGRESHVPTSFNWKGMGKEMFVIYSDRCRGPQRKSGRGRERVETVTCWKSALEALLRTNVLRCSFVSRGTSFHGGWSRGRDAVTAFFWISGKGLSLEESAVTK